MNSPRTKLLMSSNKEDNNTKIEIRNDMFKIDLKHIKTPSPFDGKDRRNVKDVIIPQQNILISNPKSVTGINNVTKVTSINPFITKAVNCYKFNEKNPKKTNYNSGHFDMPLISKILK